MKYLNIIYLILIILLPSCLEQGSGLKINEKIQAEIAPPDVHRYQISLGKDRFCALLVQQEGVDLLIKLIDPAGDTLRSFDTPNGRQGPEFVSFFSEKKGIYTITVSPLNQKEPKGHYYIQLLKKEAKAKSADARTDQLFSAWDVPGSPGAAVAIAHGNEIIYSKGYGLADLEYNIPNTPATIFHIASVSKQFTAFSIAVLADQKKLSLDDDIRKYLPELNDFGETITIRHLIHHTSGLRDQWNLLALAGWRLDDVITKNQVLRLIGRQKELNFKPGARMMYCNTGYTLLAEIVSRVTGKSFPDWTRENIFIPLGMYNTLFYDDHEKIVPGRAYSYQSDGSGYKKSVLSYANVGATSLFTTVEDITKWADNFTSMKAGNANVMRMMNEKGILNKGDTLTYAFGQEIETYKGLKTISHGGADAGYRTFLLRFPDQQYSIAVFSNLASFDPGGLAYQVADIYLRGFLKEDKPENKKVLPGVKNEKKPEVSEALLREYAGRYDLMPGLVVEFRIEGGKLVGQATGQPSVSTEAITDSSFFVPAANGTLTFKRGKERKVNRFTLLQGGSEMTATRLPDFDPGKVNLKSYTGTFYSSELQTAYTFEVKNDTLVANHQRHDPIKLIPLVENAFSSEAWFMGKVEFTLNERKEITGCMMSSGRVMNLKFKKTTCLQ
jgi:CubicO group peptidase (beta-lactamase class C family)